MFINKRNDDEAIDNEDMDHQWLTKKMLYMTLALS